MNYTRSGWSFCQRDSAVGCQPSAYALHFSHTLLFGKGKITEE